MQSLIHQIKLASFYLSTHVEVRYFLILLILFISIVIFFRTDKEKIDVEAIAGDDVISTQLDLAQAYIEMNQYDLAKQILKQAIKQGSAAQQTQARELLTKLS